MRRFLLVTPARVVRWDHVVTPTHAARQSATLAQTDDMEAGPVAPAAMAPNEAASTFDRGDVPAQPLSLILSSLFPLMLKSIHG